MNSVVARRQREYMARLLVHVEGETEETFVNEILAPHLRQHGFDRVSARLNSPDSQAVDFAGCRLAHTKIAIPTTTPTLSAANLSRRSSISSVNAPSTAQKIQ